MKRLYLLTLSLVLFLFAQAQINIDGFVKSESNESLPAANIIIKGTSFGTNTDDTGYFKLSDIKLAECQLQVSYLGYETQNIFIDKDTSIAIFLKAKRYLTEDVIVRATRAAKNTPIAFTNIDAKEIENQNLAQDIPFLLSLSPSTVVSSDAGAGIGYTSISIRGSDAKRINVTIDGIPINDPESHSVYWVNMPDLASSIDNIQIQRGVGTSTNGAGAFGASINILSDTPDKNAYAVFNTTAGSFGTLKNNVRMGTGLIKDKFSIDTRLSRIVSNGFIDRASSNLQSFMLTAEYRTDRTIIKSKILAGKEKTYQAWMGVPKVRLENDTAGMQRYLDHWLYTQDEYENMINSDSRTYNFYTYDNQTDNYNQNHFYLIMSHQFSQVLSGNINLHYTKGKGYYESYKDSKKFSDYNLSDVIIGGDTLTRTDLIQQKWLDNDFYGLIFSLNYEKNKMSLTFGGAANNYDGNHFGKIIWSQYASNGSIDKNWYENKGLKTDMNVYSKLNYQLFPKLNLFVDIQYRHIKYSVNGIHDDLWDISMDKTYDFINPKFGFSLDVSKNMKYFLSLSSSNREPSRRNYIDAINGNLAKPERLVDFELGGTYLKHKTQLSANIYYMDYHDQLVLTGEINNVGDAILSNVNKSYRMGLELVAAFKLSDKFLVRFNAGFSKNKIENFIEYVDDWDTGEQIVNELGETDLAFSPSINTAGVITFTPLPNFSIDITGQYVGRQFIDNTSDIIRSLNPYFVNNIGLNYKIENSFFDAMELKLKINNVFNVNYETNAWVYRYYYQNDYYTMDGYFPQAGTNFLLGLTITL